MTSAELVVTSLGAAAIVWELWYFLLARRPGLAGAAADGVQEVHVIVKGGYTPDTVVVQAGKPVRMQFYRDETAECSARLVLEAFGIDQELPAFETTPVEFTPQQPGEYPFRCGRSVLQGLVVVEPVDAGGRASSPHKFHG